MKLGKFSQMFVGLNSRTQKNEEIDPSKVYTAEDLTQDLDLGSKSYGSSSTGIDPVVRPGDIVYNLSLQKAAIVSDVSAGKILSQREVKIIIDRNICDAWYLCYLLNESELIQHQLYQEMKSGMVRSVRGSQLNSLDIKLVKLEIQIRIGEIYRSTSILRAAKLKTVELEYQAVRTLIEKTLMSEAEE